MEVDTCEAHTTLRLAIAQAFFSDGRSSLSLLTLDIVRANKFVHERTPRGRQRR